MNEVDTTFGYKNRHAVVYSIGEKSGRITLWSFYDGGLFGNGNINKSFPFGGPSDIFGLLVGLKLTGRGQSHGFTNKDGTLIKIYKKDNITYLKLGGNSNTGELTVDEVEDLELILKDILVKIGVAYTEIERNIVI